MKKEKNSTLEIVKDWFTLIVAVATCVAAIIFWVQSSSDSKFNNIQNQISSLRSDIDKMQENNQKILRIIGRLEGKIDN